MSELPQGWATANLGDLLREPLCNGLSIKGSDVPPGVAALRLSAMSNAGFNYSDVRYLPVYLEDVQTILVCDGDFFVARGNGSLHLVGRGTVAQAPPQPTIFPDTMIRLRLSSLLAESRWVPSIWAARQVREQVERSARTTAGIFKIAQGDLERMTVPVPPVNEQRRIVTKIGALTARSRAAREALEQVQPLLERFRQSVLAAAFRGDLTAEWRQQHPDVEPASVLLERIRAERRRRWEEAELAAMRAKGKEPANDKWKEKYEEPAPADSDGLPSLPPGWCWASLDELLVSLRNGIATKPDADSGLPILRISAVRPLSVDLADVRYLAPDVALDGYLLASGDLLFTRYNGNPRLVGVCGVVRTPALPTVYPDKLIRGRTVSLVDGDYLAAAVNCGSSRAFIDDKTKTAAGQVGISGSDLKLTPVPLAPAAEQAVIARLIERSLGMAASVDDTLASLLGALTRLDQSILAKAFRGELVPQDPNDEPASVLLDRIRAEREAAGANGGRRGRRARTSEAEPSDTEHEPDDEPAAARANGTNGSGSKLHAVLGALKREALHRIADAEGVELADRRSLDAAREGVIEGGVTLEAALEHLDRDELKAVCRALGLEDRGRAKGVLRARVLAAGA